MSWFHLVNSPKGKRNQFPKVLIGDIRNFPFKIDPTAVKKIDELVNKIIEKKDTSADSDTQSLEEKLDQLIYSLYGLTSDQIEIIEQQMKSENEKYRQN
jgi:adenine-specific DNA-methyltransferase